MDKLKQWIAFTVIAVLVIVVGSWFLLVSPKRSEAADVRQQVDSQLAENRALMGQISLLKAQAKSLPQKQAKLAAVAAKIPGDPALPKLIRALTAAADVAGIELVSLSPSQPVAVVDPAATTVRVTPGAGAAKGSKAPGRTAVPGAAAAGLLQTINVSLSVVGGYFQIEQFLDRLESLSRAMRVSAVSLSPGTNPLKVLVPGQAAVAQPGTLVGTVTASVFMATGRAAAAVPGK